MGELIVKYIVVIIGLLLVAGCYSLDKLWPSAVAKKSAVDALATRVEKLEVAGVETGETFQKIGSEVGKHRKRLDAVENDAVQLKRDVAGKLDANKLNASLDAWARGRQFVATPQFDGLVAGKLGEVHVRMDQLNQQLASKMSRFQVLEVAPSISQSGGQGSTVCMRVLDRQTAQWYCWQWMPGNEAATTKLLVYRVKSCPCGKCGVWVEVSSSDAQNLLQQEGLPVPMHMLNAPQGSGREPDLGPGAPVPMPPSPGS